MSERIIELFIPERAEARVREIIEGSGARELARLADGDRVMLMLLLETSATESLLDTIRSRLSLDEDHTIVVLPVQVSLPVRKDDEESPEADSENGDKQRKSSRISREELYADLQQTVSLSGSFFVFTALATVVAAVGLVRSSPAIVIGAMVIAPMLGPNIALSLATTLADRKLAVSSLRSNAAGFITALVMSVIAGMMLEFDRTVPEIASRSVVGFGDIVLALASGVAGALAFSTGLAASLVGVMVAVALLPPTVVLGLFVGQGEWRLAAGAGLLLATNLVCVNLAGVGTFFVQGIKPHTWWKAERSKRMTLRAMALWAALLALLSVLIWLSRQI